jgi:hypothetical protein
VLQTEFDLHAFLVNGLQKATALLVGDLETSPDDAICLFFVGVVFHWIIAHRLRGLTGIKKRILCSRKDMCPQITGQIHADAEKKNSEFFICVNLPGYLRAKFFLPS